MKYLVKLIDKDNKQHEAVIEANNQSEVYESIKMGDVYGIPAKEILEFEVKEIVKELPILQ